MNMLLTLPPLHGAFGILDELLAGGILLAFGLVIFFVAALFGKQNKNSNDEHS